MRLDPTLGSEGPMLSVEPLVYPLQMPELSQYIHRLIWHPLFVVLAASFESGPSIVWDYLVILPPLSCV